MSADNWAECPKCKAKRVADRKAVLDWLRTQYGKIDPDEFVSRTAEANKPFKGNPTLREDYEIGITENDKGDAVFSVSFGASCRECGFEFNHSVEVPIQ